MCLISYVRCNTLIVILIFGFIQTSSTPLPEGFLCFQKGSCSCEGSDGETIDLTPLTNSEQPLVAATNKNLYFYHPCNDIFLKSKVNTSCLNSFGLCHFAPKVFTDKPLDYHKVLTNETFGNFTKLAINNDAVFTINPRRELEIVYKYTIDGSNTKTTHVTLNCDENLKDYKLSVDKTTPSEHKLTLTSRYSCIKIERHLSGGAVFFIIMTVLFAMYFIGGILILKFIRGATGVEMIPNHEFWCKIPQFAKDGFKYISSCGKSSPDSYEKI